MTPADLRLSLDDIRAITAELARLPPNGAIENVRQRLGWIEARLVGSAEREVARQAVIDAARAYVDAPYNDAGMNNLRYAMGEALDRLDAAEKTGER